MIDLNNNMSSLSKQGVNLIDSSNTDSVINRAAYPPLPGSFPVGDVTNKTNERPLTPPPIYGDKNVRALTFKYISASYLTKLIAF